MSALICKVCGTPVEPAEATIHEGEHYCRICVRALKRSQEGRGAVVPEAERPAPTTPGLAGVTARSIGGATVGGGLWWSMVWVFPAFPCALGALVTGWLTARLGRVGLSRDGGSGAVFVVGTLVVAAVVATEVLVNVLALTHLPPSRELFERAFAAGLPANPGHLLILVAVSVPLALITLSRGRASSDAG